MIYFFVNSLQLAPLTRPPLFFLLFGISSSVTLHLLMVSWKPIFGEEPAKLRYFNLKFSSYCQWHWGKFSDNFHGMALWRAEFYENRVITFKDLCFWLLLVTNETLMNHDKRNCFHKNHEVPLRLENGCCFYAHSDVVWKHSVLIRDDCERTEMNNDTGDIIKIIPLFKQQQKNTAIKYLDADILCHR